MSAPSLIRPKERDAILQALAAGVVPRIGQRHIQVGRLKEVQALLRDLERVADGGATLRFVIGDYGSLLRWWVRRCYGPTLRLRPNLAGRRNTTKADAGDPRGHRVLWHVTCDVSFYL
jgi:hypothetical protein